MPDLRIFIWEGDGISDAYHDDGTLVVSPEQAREIARATAPDLHLRMDRWDELRTTTWFDGESCDTAIDREPDRVVDLDEPRIVAFNGGGYD